MNRFLEVIRLNLEDVFPLDSWNYLSHKKCFEYLRSFAGMDLGDDKDAWHSWICAHLDSEKSKHSDEDNVSKEEI
jgi:hypothetical protein